MNVMIRDTLSTLLAVFGGVVMFAKLESYHWILIGSWRGALGVLGVTGLAILLTNIVEVVRAADGPAILELAAWLGAAVVAVSSLAVTTTKLEFIWSGAIIGLAWLVQTSRHAWRATHEHTTNRHHYMPVG